jgi:GTP-binding protein
MYVPNLILIGRSNVGKSELFNALSNSRDALVINEIGTTKDLIFKTIFYKTNKFLLIDTAGFITSKNTQYKKDINDIMGCIDQILFVIDSKSGICPEDHLLLNEMRKYNKNIHLVANKIDGQDQLNIILNNYQLGIKDITLTSATHRIGIDELKKNIFTINEHLFTSTQLENNLNIYDKNLKYIKFAISGQPNVGKSTLMNALIKDYPMKVTVDSKPGTTRESISYPLVHDNNNYIVIDTAGIKRQKHIQEKVEKISIIKTLSSIKYSDIVLLLIDIQEYIRKQDLSIMQLIYKIGKPLIIVVNKCDIIDAKLYAIYKKNIIEKLNSITVNYKLIFISAKCNIGIDNLFKNINHLFNKCYLQKFSTSLINKILFNAIEYNAPPSKNGKKLKLRYAHIGSQHPLTIIIYSNNRFISPTYKQYLKNFFIKSLNLIGSTIHLIFKNKINPYI